MLNRCSDLATIVLLLSSQWLQQVLSDTCAACLSSPSSTLQNYFVDPSLFPNCRAIEKCCFDCTGTNVGSIAYYSDVSYAQTPHGSVPQAKQIVFAWPGVSEVRYRVLAPQQPSNLWVKYTDSNASHDGNYFYMCPPNMGTIVFRGFYDNGNGGTPQYNLTVSSASGTCPSSPLPVTHTPEVECNLQRGSIENGVCVCASDWAGPPNCNNLPVWKWLVSIGGGLAALISIVVSIHALVQRRKRKHRDTLPSLAKDDDDVEVLHVTPDARQGGPYIKSDEKSSKMPSRNPVPGVIAPSGSPRECTL